METDSQPNKEVGDIIISKVNPNRKYDHKIHSEFSFNVIDQNNQKTEKIIKINTAS